MITPAAASVIRDEPVLDRIDWRKKLGLDTGLFANFSQCGLLDRFARVDDAFRQLSAELGHDSNDRDFRDRSLHAEDNSARGNLFDCRDKFVVVGVVHCLFISVAMVWSSSVFIAGPKPVIFFTIFPPRSNTAVCGIADS